MKKLSAILMALILAVTCFAACGKGEDNYDEDEIIKGKSASAELTSAAENLLAYVKTEYAIGAIDGTGTIIVCAKEGRGPVIIQCDGIYVGRSNPNPDTFNLLTSSGTDADEILECSDVYVITISADNGNLKFAMAKDESLDAADFTESIDVSHTMITTTAAETSAAESTTEAAAAAVWTLATPACTLPDEVKTAFDLAVSEYTGMSFEPVALLGSQVVAGTNYAVLCQGTITMPGAEPKLVIATVYADLTGGAEITDVVDFDLDKYTTESSTESKEQLAGGWGVSSAAGGTNYDASIATAITKADKNAEVLTCLAVSNGTSAMLVLTKSGSNDVLQIVTIDGSGKITNTCNFNF